MGFPTMRGATRIAKKILNIPKLLETRPKFALVYGVPHNRGARLVSRKK
jgi:hypothetical protein